MSFHCSSQLKKTNQETNYVLIEKECLVCSRSEYSISKRLSAGLWLLHIKSFSCRSHPTLLHKSKRVKGVFKTCCSFSKEIVPSTDLGESLGYLKHPNKHLCLLKTASSFNSNRCCSLLFKKQILHEETVQQHLNFILQQFTGTVKDVW